MVDDASLVLLVEDNPDDAELIAYAFRKADIANPLYIVDDGDKAIDYLHGRADYVDRSAYPLPAVILLDLKLPRRSGFEILEDIRRSPATRRIPVVVLTSSNQQEDIARSYDLGANAFMVKPIGRDALLAMIESFEAFWLKLNEASVS